VQASWLLFSRIASVDETCLSGLGGNLNTGAHFGIHLNDLGRLREILLWIRLLTTAERNNFRFTKFLINFLSNVDGSAGVRMARNRLQTTAKTRESPALWSEANSNKRPLSRPFSLTSTIP
jgi:hypothetical protein